MMTSREIRQSFLDFFKGHGHTIVPSAPVVPHGDPTLLFTNAGMNQFKDVFLGTGTRDYSRAVDTQKCIRVSGKHNDLEEVGHDTYHHTFFEMLGNWSFGDYYKAEAIAWAWGLLTDVWGLQKERLHATVYRTDDEAYDIWKKYLPEDHIHRFDEKDNFWEMGETGPCGPCSEIHYDHTPDLSGGRMVNAGVPEVIEIWNNVFIQYNRNADKSLTELPAKHVDTGMGFERICAVIQGKISNYDTDVFAPLLVAISQLAGRAYTAQMEDRHDIAMRVVADHIRTLTFAIADGASPGNAGRGYVLRRILRRAVKYAYLDLGVKEPVLFRLVPTLVQTMGDVFPEVAAQQDYVQKIIRSEEESFLATLDRGVHEFEERSKDGRVSAHDAFFLYDTCGFPLDLTQLLAREKGMTVDAEGYQKLMEEQKARARQARRNVSQQAVSLDFQGGTQFLGYDQEQAAATVAAVTEHGLVLDRTPFYAEMGGQQADTGLLTVGGEKYHVSDVQKVGAAWLHIVDENTDGVTVGESVQAEVDHTRRAAIDRNHSATHLLHEALRRVLGTHVQQSGSLVAPDRLRFDFNHFNKVSDAELNDIQAMVNAKIREALAVETRELSIEQARKVPNVKMFFGDKYGSRVRVVTMDPTFSVEFCGGTHVANTANIGFVKLLGESSIQSGVRRVEAVSGTTADELLLDRYAQIDRLSRRLGVSDRELYERVEALLDEKKALEKQIAEVQLATAAGGLDSIIGLASDLDGVRIVSGRVQASDNDALKQLGDELRGKLTSAGVGVLGAELDGKAALVCVVTDDLTGKYPAGKIVGAVARLVGGGGGGKAHLATAGGKDVDKLDQALGQVWQIVKAMN